MKLTKKEKSLIFVLIIILLIGGFYVYGIMPQKDALEANEAEIKRLRTEIDNAKNNQNLYSDAKYKNYERTIAEINKKLEEMAEPGVDTTKEMESGNLDKNDDPHDVVFNLQQIMAIYGINSDKQNIKISDKIISNGKISYTYTTQYTCNSLSQLNDFIDYIARNMSYYITSMTFAKNINENTGEENIGGNIAITITYLDI